MRRDADARPEGKLGSLTYLQMRRPSSPDPRAPWYDVIEERSRHRLVTLLRQP